MDRRDRNTTRTACRPQEKARASQVIRAQGINSALATTEPDKNNTTSTDLPTTTHVSYLNGPINNKYHNDKGGSESCRIQRAIKNLQRAIQNSL